MEDKEQKVDRFEAVTYERAVEHFINKSVSQTCGVCGQSDGWTVTASLERPDSLTRYFGLPQVDSVGGLYLAGTYPLIICACNNCGYIRLHSAAAIDRLMRKDEKPNEQDSGDQQ